MANRGQHKRLTLLSGYCGRLELAVILASINVAKAVYWHFPTCLRSQMMLSSTSLPLDASGYTPLYYRSAGEDPLLGLTGRNYVLTP